jgi:hypothetical protein
VTDFNQTYKMAVDLIQYLVTLHGFIEPNATVCVLVTKTGRVFNGVSHNEVHAEIEAVRNMQGFNETAVDSLILVDANTRMAMLPCAGCIQNILTLNPINNEATVCMPDRAVPFREILAPTPAPVPVAMPAYSTIQQGAQVSATRSSVVATDRSKSALLSGKVNNLLAAAKPEVQSDEDIELMNELTENAQKKKGLFGGLFGRK